MIRFKKLDPAAKLPTRATPGSSGYDLHAVSFIHGDILKCKTGLAVEIPLGWRGEIRDRSSLAIKGYHVVAGEIDSDYRGELIVLLSSPPDTLIPNCGDRVAQIVFTPHATWEPVWADELSDTHRGEGGFGHTGR